MRTTSRSFTSALALVPLFSVLTACQSDPLPQELTEPPPAGTPTEPETGATAEDAPAFLRVAREAPAEDGGGTTTTLIRQMLSSAPGAVFNPNENFYLAVHRRELGKRWFLSAYMKQFFPGAVEAGAAYSLGTRVVTFRVQNGNLYLFDVDKRKQTSDTFGQEVLVDAYPLVDVSKLVPGAISARALKDYVVVDPSAGLNRFGVVADAFGQGGLDDYAEKLFEVELKFCQRFRAVEDGITFEQAFTGYSETPRSKDETLDPYFEWSTRVEPNLFRASGILGLALRRYQEGEGFKEAPGAPNYFTSDPRLVPNEGYVETPATKWNVHPGKPIEWLISPLVEKIQQQPEMQEAGIDLVGAVKKGIESWNEAFGFEALTARVADPGDSFAEDDKNYLIWDVNPAIGYAYANWRVNPNTGEIRGASVYFNDIFRDIALTIFGDTARPAAPAAAPAQQTTRPALTWQPFPHQRLCDLTPPAAAAAQTVLDQAVPVRTAKERIEDYIAHVVSHEIGHTLGLRHNFKGSLMPVSSSVMDYILDAQADQVWRPGPYDVDAIKYLYLGGPPPKQPFCNDDGVGKDPTCERFDAGVDPLRQHWIPRYTNLLRRFLTDGNPLYGYYASLSVRPLVNFTRRARLIEDRALAYQSLIADITANADVAGPPRPPAFVQGANIFSQIVMSSVIPDPRLYVNVHPSYRPDMSPLHPQIEALFVSEARANVLDLDGRRQFPTRRFTVDILKRMQTLAGYNTLREARQLLATPVVPPLADQEALLEDLRARIDAATKPYFIN